jgi:hypothetical protein
MNTLKQFLREVNSIGFWGRIFGWNKVRMLIADAMSELDVLTERSVRVEKELTDAHAAAGILKAELRSKEMRVTQLEKDAVGYDVELVQLREEVGRLRQKNTILEKEEEQRIRERDLAVNGLTETKRKIERDQEIFLQAEKQKELDKLQRMKETWSVHQLSTAERIKAICQKHTIAYIDKVPFKGDPDNTVSICDEYIVFDAKSPAGDDLSNFPIYLKGQAEKAIKYAKQENVKKDIYFVVPSNTIEHLTQFVYPHADHDVYIIAADAIEPILLSLQKIEAYEFAEELTPDQRANICRVIGRFAHLAKRRIQVDHFFATQTIELAYACENYLPQDILEQVKEYERAEKLNPPMEKRTKSIPVAELEKDTEKVQREAEGRGVVIDPEVLSTQLGGLPLHKS